MINDIPCPKGNFFRSAFAECLRQRPRWHNMGAYAKGRAASLTINHLTVSHAVSERRIATRHARQYGGFSKRRASCLGRMGIARRRPRKDRDRESNDRYLQRGFLVPRVGLDGGFSRGTSFHKACRVNRRLGYIGAAPCYFFVSGVCRRHGRDELLAFSYIQGEIRSYIKGNARNRHVFVFVGTCRK